jgi:hypothetical protein
LCQPILGVLAPQDPPFEYPGTLQTP